MRQTILVTVTIALLCAISGVAYGGPPVERITVRSGQVGGVPGPVGGIDDIVSFNPAVGPPFSPIPSAFTPAYFLAATVPGGGQLATVIFPFAPWFPALVTDPLARWIDFAPLCGIPFPSICSWGAGGSVLYAVPFVVISTTITSATIQVACGVDDALGDLLFGGPNSAGLYINTTPSDLSTLSSADCNFGVPTVHFLNIPSGLIVSGQNYLYFYGRDAGGAPSGLIFSATITVNGCVLTQGYWKNHPGNWPGTTPSLTLGTLSYSPAQLLAILGQPVQGNGLVSLAHQLITALLNQANGAPVPPTVQTALNAADTLIDGLVVPPIGSGYLSPSLTSSLINTLDAYNNGQLSAGPPHCGN